MRDYEKAAHYLGELSNILSEKENFSIKNEEQKDKVKFKDEKSKLFYDLVNKSKVRLRDLDFEKIKGVGFYAPWKEKSKINCYSFFGDLEKLDEYSNGQEEKILFQYNQSVYGEIDPGFSFFKKNNKWNALIICPSSLLQYGKLEVSLRKKVLPLDAENLSFLKENISSLEKVGSIWDNYFLRTYRNSMEMLE